jgi:hypothetical protein
MWGPRKVEMWPADARHVLECVTRFAAERVGNAARTACSQAHLHGTAQSVMKMRPDAT